MSSASQTDAMAFDAKAIRAQFPVLAGESGDSRLVYLDSGASSQKPRAVIDAIDSFYKHEYASVHRGLYALSSEATRRFEDVRAKVCRLLGTKNPHEVVFTRGTTESINLVAQSWGRSNLEAGDEILITQLEHHSNIVPWQLLCEQTGAVLKVVPINERGEVEPAAFEARLSSRTKIAAVAHVSNALGTVLPVSDLCSRARSAGALTLVDGAQAVPHVPVDLAEIKCDFYAFSAHKMFGPTGTGVLWGRHDLLEAMPPYQGGGSMIQSVRFEGTTFASPPQRFEAGTPDVAGVIGLGAALDWFDSVDRVGAFRWEDHLLETATRALETIPGLRILGTAAQKVAVISFVLDCAHPHDIATILDQHGVAVRAGHHCAQPLMEFFGVPATARASLALYNTLEDIDALVEAIEKTRKMFS
ncbi:MAG: cysteine desulfurase [Myxococcota bacterium]|nr:cysteine desulfurase [Myxococcota bacterium]